MFQYPQNPATTRSPSHKLLCFLSLVVRNSPLLLQTVTGCTQPVPVGPQSPVSVRNSHQLPKNFRSQIHLRAGVLNAICIHHLRQCQQRISTARPWRNLPLNHRPPRPPSSVLFCLKLKPPCALERRTSKCGKGSPTLASISPAKPFAD